MSTSTNGIRPAEWSLSGRHVLLALVAFFGVIFAVNGVFLYSALSTYTGVVANEPYRKGLKYNDRIAAAEEQNRLGWRETLNVDTSGLVTVVLTDTTGAPVTGLAVSGLVERPSTRAFDIPVVFAEMGPGTYVARARPLEPGNWVISIDAKRRRSGDVSVFRSRTRLWLKS
jgi:nitrogen fixation protein FixH